MQIDRTILKLNDKITWNKVRFDEICSNISNRINNPKEAETDYYVGLEHLESEQLKIRKHGTPDDVSATKLKFESGQILFGKRRFYQRKLAVANREGICSAHMLVLENTGNKIISEFLPYFMQSEEFFQRALMISEGSLSPTIKWKTLAKEEFLIPDKNGQKIVVDIISKIDENIDVCEELFNSFSVFKKSMLHNLLYPSKDVTYTKLENSDSESWESTKLGEILDFEYGPGLPKRIRKSGKIPVYGSNGIVGTHNTAIVKGEGIIVGRKGTVGSVHWSDTDFWPIDTTYYVVSRRDDISLRWLYYKLQQLRLDRLNPLATVPGLNRNDVYNLEIQIPPKKKREELEINISKLKKETELVLENLTKIKQLRKSLLSFLLRKSKTEQGEENLV